VGIYEELLLELGGLDIKLSGVGFGVGNSED
jgi:hypothetical protein